MVLATGRKPDREALELVKTVVPEGNITPDPKSDVKAGTGNSNLPLEYSATTAAKGIVFLEGFPTAGGPSEIQSVLFEKAKWTEEKARKWLKEHNMKAGKVDVTAQYLRFRQHDPEKYSKIRTKKV